MVTSDIGLGGFCKWFYVPPSPSKKPLDAENNNIKPIRYE